MKLCLVDMNNGVANQATRCFRRIMDAFTAKVTEANPGLEIQTRHVQPRNLGELPSDDVDFVLSSGGPGSPLDGWDEPWCTGYRAFLDRAVEQNLRDPAHAPQVFVVCHSFEIVVEHFGIAQMQLRDSLKFGVFPSYTTPAGMKTELFAPFGDRLFTWEHRNWEAVGLDEKKLAALGGEVLASESRPGRDDKGSAFTAFKFAPGVVGTQFHPEADLKGVLTWVEKPEHADRLIDAYGNGLYERMLTTLRDPGRLGKTFALVIPSWLTRRFNRWAAARDLKPIGMPVEDMAAFEAPVLDEQRVSA